LGIFRNLYRDFISHTSHHVSLVCDHFPEGFSAHAYIECLDACAKSIELACRHLRAHHRLIEKPNEFFRKWREADVFQENLLAVQIALREFASRTPLSEERRLTIYGLAYGGIEIPAIGVAVGVRMHLDVTP